MTRISRVEITHLCAEITKDARQLGLIPEDAAVLYRPGSTTNGHAPEVMVMSTNGTGHVPVSFLPSFTYKHTAKDVHLALTATRLALDVVAAKQ